MQTKIKEYIEIIEKVSKVEQRRIPQHMVDYEELVSIGIIAVQSLIKNKTPEQLERYNKAYIATAIRWAIRNELRNRYKWYSMKHKTQGEEYEAEGDDSNLMDGVSPNKVREAVYETILSIDYIAASSSENDSPFDFIRDNSALPDEQAELMELSRTIKSAIAHLPKKERIIVEYRFYRNMQIKDIARQVGLSPSRVTRVVQASLNSVRQYLAEHEHTGY